MLDNWTLQWGTSIAMGIARAQGNVPPGYSVARIRLPNLTEHRMSTTIQ